MDAWDASAFGNDSASDWLTELLESNDMSMIKEAFDSVLAMGDEPVEMQVGEEGIAAADVVAWLYGRPGKADEFGEQIESWMDEHELEVSEPQVKKARKVVDRVLKAPSELRDEWEASDDFESWTKALADLKERLS